MEIALRPATLADVEPLFAIHRAAMREYVTQAYGPWDDDWQAGFFRGHFEGDVRRVVVVDGSDVGFLDVVDHAGHILISELVIDPAWHNRGIGSELLRGAMAKAAARGVEARLQVLQINPARRLYERLGFVIYGVTPTHYLMHWRRK